MVAIMGRSLLVGVLAWILGNGALRAFPSGHHQLIHIGDWLSLLLFSPVELLLSAFLFALASFLLFGLLHFHVQQYIFLRNAGGALVWMHLTLCLFTFFLLVIQFAKMPVATTFTAVLAVMYEMTRGDLLFLGKRRN